MRYRPIMLPSPFQSSTNHRLPSFRGSGNIRVWLLPCGWPGDASKVSWTLWGLFFVYILCQSLSLLVVTNTSALLHLRLSPVQWCSTVKGSLATTVSWLKVNSGSGCRHITTSPITSGTLDLSSLSAHTQLSGTAAESSLIFPCFGTNFVFALMIRYFQTILYFYDLCTCEAECFHICRSLTSLFCPNCSYAEVRAEQRRELGIEETNTDVTMDKVRYYYQKSTYTFQKYFICII